MAAKKKAKAAKAKVKTVGRKQVCGACGKAGHNSRKHG